ncbi:MAG: hypothetical protein PHQ00_01785, partial [Phycisphaerae bacterium]|nr:hypothetical protein [Phycisphaerae bacterium]
SIFSTRKSIGDPSALSNAGYGPADLKSKLIYGSFSCCVSFSSKGLSYSFCHVPKSPLNGILVSLESISTRDKYFPDILGDLPVIGLAFKSTDTKINSSELLVLLSPHIYDKNSDKLTDIQMQRYDEITKRPLLTIPEADERREKEEKARKAKEEKEAKKAKKLSKK